MSSEQSSLSLASDKSQPLSPLSRMEELMRRMARLDTRELSSQEFQMAVLTALEEVTAQQQRTRRTLDRLLRRENREAVRHLLDQEEDTENVESGQWGNFKLLFFLSIKNSIYIILKILKQFIFSRGRQKSIKRLINRHKNLILFSRFVLLELDLKRKVNLL